jgi:hypothetical protein
VAVMAGEVGVPDKPQMGLVPRLGEGLGQPGDARGDAPGAGIVIGAFEGEQVKLHGATLRHIRARAMAHRQPERYRRVVDSPPPP